MVNPDKQKGMRDKRMPFVLLLSYNDYRLTERRRIHQTTLSPKRVLRTGSANTYTEFSTTHVGFVDFIIVSNLANNVIGPIFAQP